MDGLTFSSNLIQALVWPAFLLLILGMFYEQIKVLLLRIQRLKYKDFETEFKELTVSGQSLLFLDGVARKEQWTFYKLAREGERRLGQAFSILVDDLLTVEKEELLKRLTIWLKSDDSNCVWFASEIIGYFKIGEMAEELKVVLPDNVNSDLPSYKLNCLWAYARVINSNLLIDALVMTRSTANQHWLLFTLEQMHVEEHISPNFSLKALSRYLKREDLSDENKSYAEQLILKINLPGEVVVK